MTPKGQTSHPQTRTLVRLVLALLAVAGAAGGVSLLAVIPPTETSFYLRCQLHTLTGLHCPGCGTTRALHALLNGRIEQALAYNSLAFIILPILGWLLFQSLRTRERRGPVEPISSSSPFWMRLFLILLLAFGVLRNLPWLPFTLLAPHEL